MYSSLLRAFIVFFFIGTAHAIGVGQDSLIQQLNLPMEDTSKIDLLEDIYQLLLGTEVDSAIQYAQKAVSLADEINDQERKGYMLKNVGIAYYYKGDFVETLDYWRKSLATFERINHPKGISNLLSNIGAIYNATGDYSQAMDYFLKALRIAEEHKDDFRRATSLQNIGALFSNMEDYEQSQKYYEEALVLCKELDYKKGIATIVMNLSEVYRNIGDLDKAAEQITEAKRLFKETEDLSLPEAMIAASDLFNRQNKFREAINESKAAYALAEKNGSKAFMQRSLITMGNAYNEIGSTQSAISAFSEAIDLGNQIGVNLDLQQAYHGLIVSNRLSKNYKALSINQDSLLSINNQIYNKEKDDKISNLQLEFDLEKRETEVALLNADNEIKNQQITQAKLRSRFLTAVAAFLLLLIGGMAYLYKYAQKKNKIIIEEQSKSDQLLKNILPPETAEELKEFGKVEPKRHDFTTVLFTDFVDFTAMAGKYSPEELVNSIDYYFKRFDQIIASNNLEKIKTIGDAYMCAGGLYSGDHSKHDITLSTLKAAAGMLDFMKETRRDAPPGIIPFEIRIGISSGPVVAGVVGQSKFQFDIWGDTVNVAARMESNSEAGKINVTEEVYEQIQNEQAFTERGTKEVKNKGLLKMYFYNGSPSKN